RALADAGDRAGALQHARTHAVLLREELGIEPSTELQVLEEQLRSDVGRIAEPAPMVPIGTGASLGNELPANEPPAAKAPESRPGASVSVLVGGLLLASLAGVAILVSKGPFDAPSGTAEAPPAAISRTPDPAAHALYLRGRIAWNRRSREGLEQAVVLFRQAAERDPTYAEAYAGMADAYVILGYLGYIPGDAAFPKGKAAALQALALNPSMGEAYAALGVALQWEKRRAEADQAFIRALEYAPEYATGHQWYALLLTILGRRDEAVVHGRRAAELNPLSIQIHNTYGIMLLNADSLDSALRVYERMVTNEPDTAWVRQNPWVLSNFGKVAMVAGRHEEGVHLIERAAHAVPRHPRPLYELAVAHVMVGDRIRARAAFQQADSGHPHYPVYRALLHAQFGELDAAFEWFDRVQEWGPVTVLTLTGDRNLGTLHSDPRYAVLRRRIGLPAPR
ncbi:MAG: tetratricopeptide repeat protein, partial [Gemmatimonadota bacterium]|nr:tetratricopeptide repeat protein [Gemmatimonadota bacterium]